MSNTEKGSVIETMQACMFEMCKDQQALAYAFEEMKKMGFELPGLSTTSQEMEEFKESLSNKDFVDQMLSDFQQQMQHVQQVDTEIDTIENDTIENENEDEDNV